MVTKFKKIFFAVTCLVASVSVSFAQGKSSEIGIFLGCSFYLGDLNPNGFFNQFTRPAGGLVYRYNLNNRFAARFNAFAGEVTADDSRSSSLYQQQRNLNFKSSIYELSAQMEFNFLEYEIGSDKHIFSPYIFGGIGIFRMDPYGEYNGQWYELQPLHTEGQGTPSNASAPYHLIQPCIPFGIGIKTSFSKTICITLEWGMRKTFTGYLDDVSGVYPNPAELAAQQGPNAKTALALSNPSLNPDKASMVGTERGNGKDDWYSFAGLIISFHAKKLINACFSYF